MKKLSILLLLTLSSLCALAQKKNKYFTDEYGHPMHYDIGNIYTRKALTLLVDGEAKRVEPFRNLNSETSFYGNLTYLVGAKWVELESLVHKDSLKYLRYSIIENDQIYLAKNVTPNKIKFVWNERSGFPNHVTVDLGRVNVIGKKIEVLLTNLANKSIVGVLATNKAIIYNKPLQPANILLTRILSKTGRGGVKVTPLKNGDTIFNDAATIGLDLAIKSTDVNFIYEFLVDNDQTKSSFRSMGGDWKSNGTGKAVFNLDASFFKRPGTYEISITPRVGAGSKKENWFDTDKTVKFKFIVAKSDEKVVSAKEIIIIGLMAAAVFGAIFGASITYIKKKSQKKLFNAQQQKEISKMQLQSIRSQLNPHFLFNALAGIQNLMNQHRIEEANSYLGKFARLTRNVLDQQELVSLAEERELLLDYLQMEQLRFGFTYEIEIQPQINLNVEIPSMLLQPFVENAIKHGISDKLDKGHIHISFASHHKDLILSVSDNGTGFDAYQLQEGLGLKLSKNRISLLNTIYTESPFILEIQSKAGETTVRITLTQWL